MDFSIKKETLKKVLFNTSVLNIVGLERDIFDRVNEERKRSGIKNLKWNDKIASVAKTYSKTLSVEGFNHKASRRKAGLYIRGVRQSCEEDEIHLLNGP